MTTSQSRSEQFPPIRVHYVCGVVLILALALALNAAAQSRVVTEKPTIKVKLPDLWMPSAPDCWWPVPTWNSTDGIIAVEVANKGNASAPSSSLLVKELRGDMDTGNGPWNFYKDWWATVPPLAPGQHVQISVKVSAFKTGLWDPDGHPIKHPRRWTFKADGKGKVFEFNEKNNSCPYLTTMN
jgi:hypothetical protein